MYDVIVIGAGPSGSMTAMTAAKAGYAVLILEKNADCRSPCAGYISKTINIETPDADILQSNITRMRTYYPDLYYHDFTLNGFVVDRPLFDKHLLSKATGSGAKILWNSPLSGINPAGPYNVKFHNGTASGKIIVGADGVFSKTASILDLQPQRFAACAQCHIKGIETVPQTCEIFFNYDYAPGGYIWIYPTGKNSAKVGLGMIKNKKAPRESLDTFITGSQIAYRLNGKITEYISGALPIGGIREKLVFDNVLLAGDSAGMADPITGAGINNAMLAGELAGRTIIKALENDDIALLSEYEIKIRKLLGRPLGRALKKRKKLDACCNNELLQEHLPELWVTFKQYLDNYEFDACNNKNY